MPQGNVVQPGTTITSPPTLPGGTSTVHIPGIGTVQILNTGTPQLTIQNPALPQGAQLLQSPGQQISLATAAQPSLQALQQDPSDPSKWHVVQVPTAPTIQPIQVATATATPISLGSNLNTQLNTVGPGGVTITNGAIIRHDNASGAVATTSGVQASSRGVADANGQPVKTRLRRVACTCPNCKDGDRSRNK